MNPSTPAGPGSLNPASASAPSIEVRCRPTTAASLVLHGVPCIDALSVTSPGRLSGATVQVRVVGHPSPPWQTAVEPIAAGGTVEIDASAFLLPLDLLRRSTEREAVDLEAMLIDRAGCELARHHARLLVLPASHWVGRQANAPSLAAFVTPNSPVVPELSRVAAGILAADTGSGSLDGYQSGSVDRVQRMAGACFGALAARGVAYQVLKASFEDEGQKVRTLAEVVGERLGNCLDLSVALAALLEAAGLVVVLVVADGHAVVGFSTIGEPFPEPAQEGASAVLNRVDLGEIRLLESTLACSGGAGFGEAMARGEQWLREARGPVHVIDLHAARRAGFHPLPELVEAGAPGASRTVPGPDRSTTPAGGGWEVRLPPSLAPLPPRARSLEEARLDGWKRRLLDLTLRNKLLNDRAESGLPLLAAGEDEMAALASGLLGEATYRLLPHGGMRALVGEAAHEELGRQWLRTGLDEPELARRATKAWRESVSSVEETGARSLFVALGALQFRVEGRSSPVQAPLMLVPVELVRATRGDGFRVRAVAEDVVANAALIEHLRMAHGLDLGLLDDLAEDAGTLDLVGLLARVRQQVRDLPGAVVHATARLGNYSFKKLPLFHELRDRAADVVAHPVVRSLLGRQSAEGLAAGDLVTPESTEDLVRFDTMRLPLPADSSQLAAVLGAAAGSTFVLQGPPGTGKSQTITNLLAECLARGRRVLFVAEKAAALEVVSRRLRDAGLGGFALDLHADHASKPGFVAQVRAALEDLDARVRPGQARLPGVGSDLDRARARLRAACDALHATVGAVQDGLSVFQATERVLALADALPVARAAGLDGAMEAVLPDLLDAGTLRARIDAIGALAEAVRGWEAGATGPLGDFDPPAPVTPEAARHVAAEATRAAGIVGALCVALDGLARAMGWQPPTDLGQARRLMALAAEVEAVHPASAELAAMACADDADARIERHVEALGAAVRARAAASALDAQFDRGVLELDHATLAGDLRAVRDRFALVRWMTTRRVRGLLARFARGPLPGDLPSLLAAVEAVGMASAAMRQGAMFELELRTLGERAGAPLDVEAARGALERAGALARTLRAGHAPSLAALRSALPGSVRSGALLGALRAAQESWEALGAVMQPIDATVGLVPAWGSDTTRLGELGGSLARLATQAAALPAWSAVTAGRRVAEALGLGPLAGALVSGRLPAGEAVRVAEAVLLEGWVRGRLRAAPALADCPGDRMEPLREALGILAREYREAVPKALPVAMRERIRAAFDPEKATPRMRQAIRLIDEMRVLSTIRRPIRRVMREAAPALAELMPLVLASPLTAATFLPPEFPAFDLVVFDEASQVPVWDAACALSRGRAAVIVGDSRQLPPTNFFERRDPGPGRPRGPGERPDGAGDERGGADEPWEVAADAFETLDSLLDEAVASGLPQLRLLWHYRSRDERLIEFSNRKSYEGRLQTFPSALRGHPNLGVEFRLVPGVYDRGGTASNRVEAEAVVAEVRRRLLDPDPCPAHRSVGVVTFSEAQQSLVQDLLDEAMTIDDALSEAVAAAAATGEGVFIKNLENVQGDERATMIFSICYGPDTTGRLHHHFGPLSLSGGERRLNVAVTRAREKVVVVSSIRASDIDLARCTAQGARDLRDYLAYAENGVLPALRATPRSGPPPEPSLHEQRLADALLARGWRVDVHVGSSRDYRVGLAIGDPDVPDRWLLGVELDGVFHRAAPAVLDRDVVRAQVLRSLGWDVLRVSCLDVFRDIDAVVARIESRLSRRG